MLWSRRARLVTGIAFSLFSAALQLATGEALQWVQVDSGFISLWKQSFLSILCTSFGSLGFTLLVSAVLSAQEWQRWHYIGLAAILAPVGIGLFSFGLWTIYQGYLTDSEARLFMNAGLAQPAIAATLLVTALLVPRQDTGA